MNVDAIVSRIAGQLQGGGTPERAENQSRYLKSDLEHLGVRMPEIRRITRAALEEGGGELDHDAVVTLIQRLWARPVHDLRMAAMEVATHRESQLHASDIELVESMLRTSKTWALVDPLAVSTAGPLLARHPEEDGILDRWAHDRDFWVRRSALLAHLAPLRRGSGDWDRFCRYADEMLEEKEFFIRKAIGWILRDTARRRPDMVYTWILPRADRASGVTIREVVKRLSPDQADEVMTAYKRA